MPGYHAGLSLQSRVSGRVQSVEFQTWKSSVYFNKNIMMEENRGKTEMFDEKWLIMKWLSFND